jgi:hypothetical protein
MRRTPFFASLAALTVLACVASRADACTCIPQDFYAAYATSSAVFAGEVLDISVSAPDPHYLQVATVTIRVETAWKGQPASSTTRVVTAPNGAMCGVSFRVGARYLVYAGASATDDWSVSLCSRTHETSVDDPDLAQLNSRLPDLNLTVGPNPSDGSVWVTGTILDDRGRQARALLEVLDFQGRRVRTLIDAPSGARPHQVFWNGRDERGRRVPAGVYWVRFAYGDRVVVRELVRTSGRP